MKLKIIIFSIVATFSVSIFLYMQPKGPPPHPTMTNFIEAIKNQNHEQATLYLLSSHNREIYRKTYVRENKTNESDQSYQMDFDGAWPSYSEASQTSINPREWIEDEITQLNWMANNLRVNWRKMHPKECKEFYQSRQTLTCEYCNEARIWSPNRFHRIYEMKLNYDYEEDRIISYWVYPKSQQ